VSVDTGALTVAEAAAVIVAVRGSGDALG
jgi:hypothetical protein